MSTASLAWNLEKRNDQFADDSLKLGCPGTCLLDAFPLPLPGAALFLARAWQKNALVGILV